MNKPEIPDARECAILLLLLIGTRGGTTRVRLSETTLKRLWSRHRLNDDLLLDVTEWLFRAGWALFYAKTTYAAVKTAVVTDWPRLSSKRLDDVIHYVEIGRFEFDKHSHLLSNPNDIDADSE